jgi:hypothetical protein
MMSRAPLLFAWLLLAGCFDTPVKQSIDLERPGVVIDQVVTFKHADRYFYGVMFRPTFVTGDHWHISKFESEEQRAWPELCPTIDVTIRDSQGVIKLQERSRIAKDSGWAMTNGSQDGEFPAEVSKLMPFTPNPRSNYRLSVTVVEPCSGANRLVPHFFIERPMAGP